MTETQQSFCINCGAKLGPTDAFCPSCGTAVEGVAPTEEQPAAASGCRNCGAQLEEGVAFCTNCGTPVEADAPAATTAPAAAVNEPATATAPVAQPAAAVEPTLPQGQFKAEGKWWYRQGDQLMVFESGQWVPATRQPVLDAGSAASSAAGTAAIRYGPLIGAAAVAVSALLAWIAFAGESANSFEIPLAVLWDPTQSNESALDLGWVLIALGVAAAAFCFRPQAALARRVCGGIAILIAALYTFQLGNSFSQLGAEAPSVFEFLGVGVFVALGGGIVLALDR